uniref:RNA-binding protein 45 n=1 Tax=Cacopsylla melanoneura TaxID=428564 RepID=A0A8D8UNP7_9HEMI
MNRNHYDSRSRGNDSNAADEPPHSRLFVLCGKDVTEEDLRQSFNQFGEILEVRCVKDRGSGESKGVAYIKFSKTSSAARAVEEMNGEFLPNHNKPVKVLVAANREMGSTKKDDPECYVRLFVVVPKTSEEKDIRDHFKQFGEIDMVRIVKSRQTNESKGVAYVKYFKMSHAARAYEECDRSYKAVFARPRDDKKHTDNPYLDRSYGGQGFDPAAVQVGPGDVINNYPNPEGFTKLGVTCCISLTSDQLYGLFGIVPGLEVIHPLPDSRVGFRGGQKVSVQYSSPQSAAYARDKFHGFGFPPNTPMVVVPDFSFGNGATASRGNNSPLLSAESKDTLQTLTKALAQATSLLRSAGLSTEGIDLATGDSGVAPLGGDDSFCSVKLPSVKPLAPSNAEVAKRLFVVCQPGLPPLYSLKDVFGRFGGLIELYILPGKNCGYASYADGAAAEQAIHTLHGAELYGSRLKVMEADPPKTERRDNRKRQRLDD